MPLFTKRLLLSFLIFCCGTVFTAVAVGLASHRRVAEQNASGMGLVVSPQLLISAGILIVVWVFAAWWLSRRLLQ